MLIKISQFLEMEKINLDIKHRSYELSQRESLMLTFWMPLTKHFKLSTLYGRFNTSKNKVTF